MKQGEIVFQGISRKGTPIIIRYPKLSDASAVLKYINTLSGECTFILSQGRKFTMSEEKKWLKDAINGAKKNQAVTLMVFSNGELIGNANIAQKTGAINLEGSFGISVAKKFRSEGIGRLLMEFLLKEAKRNLKGLRIVTLGVFANNTRAIELYKKLGFKNYGLLPKGILHKGKYIDHFYMYKRIR